MYIDTYINNSDNDTINKDLSIVESGVSVFLKEDTSLEEPTIILSFRESGTPAKPAYFNYCYISEFNRYYFMTERTYSQQRYYYKLKVDPLMSFASYIEDLNVVLTRSSSRFDLYLPDPEYPVRAKELIQTQSFSNGFGGESLILAVTGGYAIPEPPEP